MYSMIHILLNHFSSFTSDSKNFVNGGLPILQKTAIGNGLGYLHPLIVIKMGHRPTLDLLNSGRPSTLMYITISL